MGGTVRACGCRAGAGRFSADTIAHDLGHNLARRSLDPSLRTSAERYWSSEGCYKYELYASPRRDAARAGAAGQTATVFVPGRVYA